MGVPVLFTPQLFGPLPVGRNRYADGVYGGGVYAKLAGLATEPPPPPIVVVPPQPFKPPLAVHAELVAADGTRYRWSDERFDPGDILTGASWASKRYEGFERWSGTLRRPFSGEFPDLELFNTVSMVGYDGSVAHEARIEQIPRTSPNEIGVEATGWMAHGRDRKFNEVYVDQDQSAWHDPPLWRRTELALAGSGQGKITAGADATGLVFTAPNEPLGQLETAELWYDAPVGVKVVKVYYQAVSAGNFSGFEGNLLWATDATAAVSGYDSTPLTFNNTMNLASLTTGRRSLMIRRFVTLPGGVTPPQGTQDTISRMAVYGTHGLALSSIVPGDAGGVVASDVVRDIAARFCPLLDASGVQTTTYPIPHLVFKDRTEPYDAFLEVNKYHLWNLAVWEDRRLHFEPFDLTDYTWSVRTTDPGVQIQLQGDSTDHLANYAVVEFTNLVTGAQDQVGPDQYPELRDDSAENPANRHGLLKEFGVQLSTPTSPDGAAQIGRAALAENNQPVAPGTITFTGHVRDRAGNWQPGWKVRAGDTIAILDHPNDRPRLVVEFQWDHDRKQGTVGVDSTLARLDAYLDRVATAVQAANVSAG